MRSRGFFLALATRSVQIVRVLRRSFRAAVSRPTFFSFFVVLTMLCLEIFYALEDIAWDLTCLIMPHERQCVIFHMIPYHLHDTIVHVYDIYNRQVERGYEINTVVFDHCVAMLYDLKFLVVYDATDHIPDLFDGVLLPMDIWFRRYGCVDETFASDPVHVADFPVSQVEMQALEDGESITSEEEDDIVILSHIWRLECASDTESDDSDYIPPV